MSILSSVSLDNKIFQFSFILYAIYSKCLFLNKSPWATFYIIYLFIYRLISTLSRPHSKTWILKTCRKLEYENILSRMVATYFWNSGDLSDSSQIQPENSTIWNQQTKISNKRTELYKRTVIDLQIAQNCGIPKIHLNTKFLRRTSFEAVAECD